MKKKINTIIVFFNEILIDKVGMSCYYIFVLREQGTETKRVCMSSYGGKEGEFIMNKLEIERELNIRYRKARSAWERGVIAYAYEILGNCKNDEIPTKKHLLNGADNWKEYSYGGCSFVYNADICLRLCTPSTIKKTKNGMRNPNGKENWLDVQTRALYHASQIILELAGMER